MADTFTPAIEPSPQTQVDKDYRVLKAEHGDGYEQRAAKGINTIRRKARVVWEDLTHAQADAIEADFDGWAGVTAFNYAVPPDATSRTWVCPSHSRTAVGLRVTTLTAEFVEVFDL